MSALRKVTIANPNILSIAEFKGHRSLECIAIINNSVIRDFTALETMPQLWQLHLLSESSYTPALLVLFITSHSPEFHPYKAARRKRSGS